MDVFVDVRPADVVLVLVRVVPVGVDVGVDGRVVAVGVDVLLQGDGRGRAGNQQSGRGRARLDPVAEDDDRGQGPDEREPGRTGPRPGRPPALGAP